MGYAPHVSGIDFNFWRSETLIATAAERLEKIYRRRRTKVVLIGQSRGGVLAKVLADRHPDQVAFVVALGSPLADPWDVHPATMGWVQAARFVNFVRYRERATEEHFLIDLEAPPKVPVLSIYSRTDGIVHWQVCRRDDVESIEVRSSHVGMGVNPDVYRILAERLAAPRQRRSA
jgi:pimeloyl-ACP methyl ester carboxylesterase